MSGLNRLFRGSSKAVQPAMATDDVYPIHILDGIPAVSEHTPVVLMRFNEILDAHKMHQSLVRVLEREDWRKLSGRIRRDEKGQLQLRVPRPFTAERPAVRYTHETFDLDIGEHPLGKQLPKTTEEPSLQHSSYFGEFCWAPGAPGHLADYLRGDEPPIALRVTSFRDATLVAVSWSHVLTDAMGFANLVKAWCQTLAGRESEIAVVADPKVDAAAPIWEREPPVAEPYIWNAMMLTGLKFFWFVICFVWELVYWRNVGARTLFLPAPFIARLRKQAEQDVPEGAFISDGDILCVWLARLIVAVRQQSRPVTLLNVVDLRSRVPSVFEKDKIYLQNLSMPSITFLNSSSMLSGSLGALALEVRQSISLQTTEAQISAIYRISMPHVKSKGNAPLFGEPNAVLLPVSNWSKAKFLELIDFSPAVISTGTDSAVPQILSGKPIYMITSQVKQSPLIRNTAVIIAKDYAGNYWVNLYMAEGMFATVEKYVQGLARS